MGSAASRSDHHVAREHGEAPQMSPPLTFTTGHSTQHPTTHHSSSNNHDSSKPPHPPQRKLSRRNSSGFASTPGRGVAGSAEELENSPIFFAMVANDHLPSNNTRVSLQRVSEQSGIVPSATAGIIPSAKRSHIRAPPASSVITLGLPTVVPQVVNAGIASGGVAVDARNSPSSQLQPQRPRAGSTPLSGSIRHSSTTSSYAVAQDTISLTMPSSTAYCGGSVGCGSLYDTEHPPLLLVPSPMTGMCPYDGQYEIPASPRPASGGGGGGGLLQFLMDGSAGESGDVDSNCAASSASVSRHHHQQLRLSLPHANSSSGTTPSSQHPPPLASLQRHSRLHQATLSSSMRSTSYHGTPTSHPDPHLFELMSSWSTAPSVDARSTLDMLRLSMTHREHGSSRSGSISALPEGTSIAAN
jgi:hypothetical protein